MLTPSISAETNKLTFDILKDLALFQKFYLTKNSGPNLQVSQDICTWVF